MNSTYGTQTPPTELRVKRDEKLLEVHFGKDVVFRLPAELLRVESPSADVQGHGPGQKKIISGRRHVGIMGVEPVGNYAIKIVFDDLHESGIFTWDVLHDFGVRQDEIWAEYLNALKDMGLSREP